MKIYTYENKDIYGKTNSKDQINQLRKLLHIETAENIKNDSQQYNRSG